MRHLFQDTMQGEFSAATNNGHKVVAFISGNHVDPDMAAELFVLDATLGDPPDRPRVAVAAVAVTPRAELCVDGASGALATGGVHVDVGRRGARPGRIVTGARLLGSPRTGA